MIDYKSEYPIAASLPRAAFALRPMRIDRDETAIHFTATTFPADPYAGCEITIRHLVRGHGDVPQVSASYRVRAKDQELEVTERPMDRSVAISPPPEPPVLRESTQNEYAAKNYGVDISALTRMIENGKM